MRIQFFCHEGAKGSILPSSGEGRKGVLIAGLHRDGAHHWSISQEGPKNVSPFSSD